MNSKIVIVNQSTGYLTIDIANALASVYDSVVLIAGSVKVAERSLDKKIKVDKIVQYNRTSGIKRIVTWLLGTVGIFFKLLFRYRNYKVLYVTNPPMSYLVASVIHNPFSIIIYDIYPEALKNVGILENNPVYRWWEKRNRKIFSKANHIYTLSNGMRTELTRYVDESKIKVVYNWAASNLLRPIPKNENKFISDNGLNGKFIVLYSGNIGYTHNVEPIIDIAFRLKEYENICFLLIGEGKKKDALIKKVTEYGLNNCKFMTWQPSDILPYSLAAADLGIVTLNNETATVSVPSKTYNLLAVGAPLLCIAPESSELNELISTYGNGECFDKGDVEGMADFILKLYEDNTYSKMLGSNSLTASQAFTYKNAMSYV